MILDGHFSLTRRTKRVSVWSPARDGASAFFCRVPTPRSTYYCTHEKREIPVVFALHASDWGGGSRAFLLLGKGWTAAWSLDDGRRKCTVVQTEHFLREAVWNRLVYTWPSTKFHCMHDACRPVRVLEHTNFVGPQGVARDERPLLVLVVVNSLYRLSGLV